MSAISSPSTVGVGNRAVTVVLLLLVSGLAYAPILWNDFVYDDKVLIGENPILRRLDSIPRLFVSEWWAGVEDKIGSGLPIDGEYSQVDRRYRPLVAVTYVLNYKLGGQDPFGYHLVNLLLHACATAMLFLFAVEVGWTVSSALVAAVLFALHPLHTEPVAWVVGRPELMMAVGVLGGLWCAARGASSWALVAFAFGLLSKEQAIVLPALVVLTDVCRGVSSGFRLKSARELLARYGGYLVVLTLYVILRSFAVGGFQPRSYPFLENPLEHLKGMGWLTAVSQMAGQYLWLVVWPATLSIDYSYNGISLASTLFDYRVLWALASWGGLTWLAAWAWSRDARVTLAVGMTLFTFAPTANLLIPVGTPFAERLFYMPLAGICLLTGLAWKHVWEWSASDLVRRGMALGLLCLILVALTIRTELRLEDWRNNESLFRSAVRALPNNAKAHVLLGSEIMKKRTSSDREEALAEFRTALDIYPDYLALNPGFDTNMGSILLDMGRTEEALAIMKQAVALSPQWGRAHYNLGLVYAKRREYGEAEHTWRTALQLAPNDPQIHSSLSRLLIERGHYQEGLVSADAALALDPDYVMARYNRALALQLLGRADEARMAYQRVLESPDAPQEAKADVQEKLRDLDMGTKDGRQHRRPCIPGLMGC